MDCDRWVSHETNKTRFKETLSLLVKLLSDKFKEEYGCEPTVVELSESAYAEASIEKISLHGSDSVFKVNGLKCLMNESLVGFQVRVGFPDRARAVSDENEIPILLTRQQWEEVYQWYLCHKEEYRVEDFEVEAAKKICETIYGKGTFEG